MSISGGDIQRFFEGDKPDGLHGTESPPVGSGLKTKVRPPKAEAKFLISVQISTFCGIENLGFDWKEAALDIKHAWKSVHLFRENDQQQLYIVKLHLADIRKIGHNRLVRLTLSMMGTFNYCSY